MSLYAGFGGQNSTNNIGGNNGMAPTSPDKLWYMPASNGGSAYWQDPATGKNYASKEQYAAQMNVGTPTFGDQSNLPTPMGSLPDPNNWPSQIRPTMEQQTGQVTVDGYTRPYDPMVDDPRNLPKSGYRTTSDFDRWLESGTPAANLVKAGLMSGAIGAHFGQTPLGTQNINALVEEATAKQTAGNPSAMPQNGPPLSRINNGSMSLVPPTNGTFLTPAQTNETSLGGQSVLNPHASPTSLGRSPIPREGLGAGWDKLAHADYGGASFNDRTYDQQAAYEKTLGARPADPIYPTPTGDAPAAPGTSAGAKTGEGHYDQNGNWVYGAVAALGAGALDAGGRVVAANILSKAAEAEAKAKADAADKASGLQDTRLQDMKDYLKPWYDDGKLALEGKDGHGGLNTFFEDNPDFQSETDPGFQRDYAFRLSEGLKSVENSRLAHGGLGGNTMRALTKYGQDMASQETNNSFNRYQTNRGMKLNTLQSRAGIGQTTAQQVGSAGLSSATNSGNAMMSAAQSRGDGITGRANAEASMYSNGAGVLSNVLGQAYGAYNQNSMMDRFERMYGKGT